MVDIVKPRLEEPYVFKRFAGKPVMIEKGEGIYLYDEEGNRYIDGSSGPLCVNIGHGIESITEAMIEQARKIAFIHGLRGYTCESTLKLAERVAKMAPGSLKKVFFVSGGSEATESAIKMARQYHVNRGNPTKYKVIARWMSYHGNTLGALSASGHIGRRRPYAPLLLDLPHIPPAYCYRCWYGKEYPNCDMECAWELERAIRVEGEEHVSAFIAEPVVGAALGAVPAPEGYFEVIREICDKYDVLFIADEVMTGFGRTGKNFGIEHWGAVPDIMACAKGMSGGYTPLGAAIAKEEIYKAFTKTGFEHGFTYGGNPLSCAIGVEVLDYIVQNNLVHRVEVMGERLMEKLNGLYKHPTVGDVHGKGLLTGIEFVKNQETKEPFEPGIAYKERVLRKASESGLSLYPGGCWGQGEGVMVGPPFIVTGQQVDEIVEILDRSLDEVERDVIS